MENGKICLSVVGVIVLALSSVMSLGQAIPVVASHWDSTAGSEAHKIVFAVGDSGPGCRNVGGWTDIVQVEAGYRHTAGLKADGTVVAVRDTADSDYGECNVGGWTDDIVQVAAGAYHTVGLKADGTVVAAGRNENGECNVGSWTGIIQVSAGGALAGGHTVGLKADGTVVAAGWNLFDQCEVSDWRDIVQISAGRHFTVGLRADGTAVAVGRNSYGQCEVGDWEDIIEVSAGAWHTVGRKAGGTVLVVGCNDWNAQWGQCEVGDWTGIIHASAGGYHTVGLKADGAVLAVGANVPRDYGQCDVGDWRDIIQVDAGKFHTVGLKADRTVVAVGGKEEANLCAIATAAYGTPMAKEIQVLRDFRDGYLLTNPLGQAFVDFYYGVSPPIAEFMNRHPGLKPVVRAGLLPAIAMSVVTVNTTLPEKMAIIGLLALVSMAVAVWLTRQRGRIWIMPDGE